MNDIAPKAEHVLIIALGDLSRISKVLKMTKSLTDAGYEVTRLGIKSSPTDPHEETDEMGRIIRLDWHAVPNPIPADQTAETARIHAEATDSPAIREALKHLLFATAPGRALRRFVLQQRNKRRDKESFARYMERSYMLAEYGAGLEPDLVISTQFHALPGGLRLARSLSIPIIYDVRDLVCEAGHEESEHPRFKRMERRLIRQADLVTTVSPQMAERLANVYGIPQPTVLYSGSVSRASEPTPPHVPIRLLFQGAFRPNRRLEELVEAMASLKGIAVLTLQGWGGVEEELRTQVSHLGLGDDVIFVPPVAPTEASLAASAHDIGVINYRGTTENLRVTVPNKLFDYMGGGLAILASDLPGHRGVIEAAECGVLFEPSGSEAIAEAVRKLADDRDRLSELKRNALAAWPRYSWAEQGRVLVREVDRLIAP